MVKKVNNISTTDTNNLDKKTDYSTKICQKENKTTTDCSKYIATQELNKIKALTWRRFCCKIKISKIRKQNWH